MTSFSHKQKLNPSKDLKLLSQDWVFVKNQSKTEDIQRYNQKQHKNNNNNNDSELEEQYSNELSDLKQIERSSAIPFLNGSYQTFYTGIKDYSSYEMTYSQTKQNKNNTYDDINASASISSLPPSKQYTQIPMNTIFNNSVIASSTSPFKRNVKSSRESTDKSTIFNSLQKYNIKDSNRFSQGTEKSNKRLNQTLELSNHNQNNSNHYDTNYDIGGMLSSVQYFSQNTSLAAIQESSDKKRRNSLFKNSNKKQSSSLKKNNFSSSLLIESKEILKQEEQDQINEIQKWSENTAIFPDNGQQKINNEKYPNNEVQNIINGLFQEIEERDQDKQLEKAIMGKYKQQRKERLAKSQQDNKIQRVNNTNIILNYSRGKDLQSNANGFQMSKYLYNQKYGQYKSIPQKYNNVINTNENNNNKQFNLQLQSLEPDSVPSSLNKQEYTVKELKSIPYKSIYNPEIDDNKRYLAAIRMPEKQQHQLKIPASKIMQNILEKYDKDQHFIVQNVEQQDNQNIIQETYGDFLTNPAKRLNISKIKQNQMKQYNVYDSRYVKPFIIEEENISEGNLFTNNSRLNDNQTPSQKGKLGKEMLVFSKYKPQESGTPHSIQFDNSTTNKAYNNNNNNSIYSPRQKSQFDRNQSYNNQNFTQYLSPQKSLFSPQGSGIQQPSPPGRNTPIRFQRHPFDISLISPQAPAINRSAPKKKKINIKTNINEISKIQEARISSPFVKVSDCERGMKQNVSSERQKFYDSWYSPASERQNNLDRHLMKYQNNKQYQQKLVHQYILLKSSDNSNTTIS